MSIPCGKSWELLLGLLHQEMLTPTKLIKDGPPGHTQVLSHSPLVRPGGRYLDRDEVKWPILLYTLLLPSCWLTPLALVRLGKAQVWLWICPEWSSYLCLWAWPFLSTTFLPWLARATQPQKAITCVWLALAPINSSCLLHMTSCLSQMAPYLSGYSFPFMLLNSFPKCFPDLYFFGHGCIRNRKKKE